MARGERRVTITSRRTAYSGRYRIDEFVFDFDRAAGKGRIRQARREVFERGDSAAALIHDTGRDVIVLTEQFRIATREKGPGYMIEAAAGSVEPGESPEACIRREIMEEVGYRAGELRAVACVYVSPGSSSERVFLYYAPVTADDLHNPAASGVAEDMEDIRRVEFTREDFLRRVGEAAFADAKLMILGQWLRSQPRQGRPAGRRPVRPA